MANYKHELADITKGLAALQLHEMHPLAVYRPMPQQLPVHESNASEVVAVGGKRCLAGWQEIELADGTKTTIEQINSDFVIASRDPSTGKKLVTHAIRPFTKGVADFYEFQLSNGESLTATLDHQVLTTEGWLSLRDAYEQQQACGHGLLVSSSDTSLSEFPRDGHDSTQTAPSYQDDCWPDCHPYDAPLQFEAVVGLAFFPSRTDALGYSRANCSAGVLEHRSRYIQTYLRPAHPSNLYGQDQTSDHEAASETHYACIPYSQPWSCNPAGRRSPSPSCLPPRTNDASVQAANQSCCAVPRIASQEKAVSIVDVKYVGKHRIWDFEVPETGNYCCAGIISHNSGKTLAAVMEFGSRILGIPITRADGTVIPLRYRKPSKRNPGLYWVIGLNIDHIGQTLYHRLFSDGLGCNFRIIPDEKTGLWKTYNPNVDKERYEHSRLSPPMLGEHLIDSKSWHFESRAGNVWKALKLRDGSVTLCAYATTGDYPKQGDAVDGIWLDEDTANAEFLKEWQDRLITVRGWFLWSIWPKIANAAYIKTEERAMAEQERDKPRIQLFRMAGSDNTYSDREGIEEGLARMDGEDDMAHRDRGDISAFLSGRRMFDFGAIHIVKPNPEIRRPQNPQEVISKILDLQKLPASWTRYLVIDPSHTRTACLVGVVPPPEVDGVEMGKRLIIEREIIVKKHTPAMFTSVLAPLIGDLKFEAFVMDQRIGRQTTVGNDMTVFQSYEVQFKQRGLMSRLTKSGFMRGCDDKSLRRRTVRDMLEPVQGGIPTLLVSQKCYLTIGEFYNYRKKEVPDNSGLMVPIDDPVNERVFDAMACIEYLCQYLSERFRDGTAYIEPEQAAGHGSMAYHSAMEMRAEMEKKAGGEYSHMGPGVAA